MGVGSASSYVLLIEKHLGANVKGETRPGSNCFFTVGPNQSSFILLISFLQYIHLIPSTYHVAELTWHEYIAGRAASYCLQSILSIPFVHHELELKHSSCFHWLFVKVLTELLNQFSLSAGLYYHVWEPYCSRKKAHAFVGIWTWVSPTTI